MKDYFLINLKGFFAFLFIWFDKILSYIHIYKFYTDRTGFKKIFYRSETKVLLGRRSRYFWWVFILFFLTILAIGFAKDSLRFLNKQMSDPFVRSVTADLLGELDDLEQNVSYQEFKYNPDSASKYFYSSIYEFSKFRNHFERSTAIPGRTVLPDDPLINTILTYKDNNAIGHGFDVQNEFYIKPEKNYSLITTYHLLQEVLKHDLEKDPPFIRLYQESIPIPIAAVVEQLPDKREYISTPYFYDQIRDHVIECFNTRDSLNKVYLIFDILPENKEVINLKVIEAFKELKNSGTTPFDQLVFSETEDANRNYVYPYNLTYRPTSFVQIDFESKLSPGDQQAAFDEFVNSTAITALLEQFGKDQTSVIKFYFPNLSYESSDKPSRQAICVSFSDLNNVKDFADSFYRTTQIELEMGMIKSLENYNFVTILTTSVSLVLIIFSFLSISFFVRNMIANHLNKIKMNIGTYKAFGIEIKTIYKNMVFVFILVSELMALLVCWGIAKAGLIYKLLTIANKDISNEFEFFYIYDLEAIVILIAMLVISYISSAIVIDRLFRNTPGDLVYNRTE